MRYVVRVAMVLAVLCAGIVLPGTAAQACSCTMGDEDQYLEWADATFAGEIVGREVVIRDNWNGSGGAHIIYTLSVDRVYSGDVPDVVEPRAGARSRPAESRSAVRGTLLVYGHAVKGHADDPVPASIRPACARVGQAHGPRPETLGSDPPLGAHPALEGRLTVTSPDEGSSPRRCRGGWRGSGAVALVIAAALGVWYWRRRPN